MLKIQIEPPGAHHLLGKARYFPQRLLDRHHLSRQMLNSELRDVSLIWLGDRGLTEEVAFGQRAKGHNVHGVGEGERLSHDAEANQG